MRVHPLRASLIPFSSQAPGIFLLAALLTVASSAAYVRTAAGGGATRGAGAGAGGAAQSGSSQLNGTTTPTMPVIFDLVAVYVVAEPNLQSYLTARVASDFGALLTGQTTDSARPPLYYVRCRDGLKPISLTLLSLIQTQSAAS
jgi:hypothetical protein